MSSKDQLHRFIFLGTQGDERLAPVRGELVQLDRSWQALLDRSKYPPAVAELLGEAAVAAVLLAATLKIDGKLTLQILSDTPVSERTHAAGKPLAVHLLVMQVTSKRELRGLARWHGDALADDTRGLKLLDGGRLVMTIETARGERYQGIVPLEGERLAHALQGYFERSEQLPTRLWLEADLHHATGLLVQKMPEHHTAADDEDWTRIAALADTVTRDELLDLPAETLLRRLFHEEDRRIYTPEHVHFMCSCTRERVGDMLRGLGHEEVANTLAELGEIEVDCEFCNARYVFDAVDAAALFVDLPHSSAQGLH
ncbi:MAG: Hsp33 family molecular chaperone HslO [Halothiobacillaceae bacterium]|nr:Hsp33 family molecular chaperone HslO [Halothiobacillaceae bacterium]